MQIVQVQATPNQIFTVLLGNQPCQITLTTRLGELYFSLSIANDPKVSNQLCLNKTFLVQYRYRGFVGDLWFFDTQGSDDPVYTGLGARFLLQYIEAVDLP